MRGLKLDSLLPSLLLIGMAIIGIVSLKFGETKVILGVQTTQPQVRTITIEDRIKELAGFANKIKSEAVVRAAGELEK